MAIGGGSQYKYLPPTSYYGGKAHIADRVVGLFCAHDVYVEPFCGGATCFFVKPQAQLEVLNDASGMVENFFSVLKDGSDLLADKCMRSIHSENLYKRARAIYKGDIITDRIETAWAFWYAHKTGFGGKADGTFGVAVKSNGQSKNELNKMGVRISNSAESLAKTNWRRRFRSVAVHCGDALAVIAKYDRKHDPKDNRVLHYLDPPYVDTNQGHYKGYGRDQYQALLDLLPTLKGNFALSSYPNPQLAEAVAKHGWRVVEIETWAIANNTDASRKTRAEMARTELVVMNYGESLSGGGRMFE